MYAKYTNAYHLKDEIARKVHISSFALVGQKLTIFVIANSRQRLSSLLCYRCYFIIHISYKYYKCIKSSHF